MIEKIAFWIWVFWVRLLQFEDRMWRRWMSVQYRTGDLAVHFIIGEV
jgi:hypothetical protein